MVVRDKRAETLSFLYIHNNTSYPSFFRHINNVTDKTAGAVLGVQGSPCPSESPIKFRVSLNGMGCITYGKPGKMCIYIPTHMRER